MSAPRRGAGPVRRGRRRRGPIRGRGVRYPVGGGRGRGRRPGGHPSDEDVAEDAAPQEGASDEEAAGPTGAEPVPDQPPKPRQGRRKAAETGPATFNGVDTA